MTTDYWKRCRRYSIAFWIMVLIAMLILILTGCQTTKNSGPKDLVQRVRQEIARQYGVIGVDPAKAAKVEIQVRVCAPTGTSDAGAYVCGGGCAGGPVTACVHAWQSSSFRSPSTEFMFADPPEDWTIRHEVGHFVQRQYGDSEQQVNSNNGHPMVVNFMGRPILTRDLIAGARWPAIVRGLAFWRTDPVDSIGCAVYDGNSNVIGVLPMQGMDGDGI